MRIIFMGTPAFGARILEELLKLHEIVLVVTQPDKKVGRAQTIEMSPVKEFALEHGLLLFQPVSILKEADPILKLPCDLIVTAAYGQFIGTKVLHHPRYRSINVHGSLLPKYRGGAPIQRALMAGETETGVTIMYMEKKMDSGDILAQEKIKIEREDNAQTLFNKLAELGAKMILPVIKGLEDGTITPIPQQEAEVTFANNLSKEDELLHFDREASCLCNQMRGLCVNPGSYFTLDGVVYKIYEAEVVILDHHEAPGTIIEVGKNHFTIACLGASAIKITSIKPEGRPLMSVGAFLNGKGKNIIIKNRRIL